MAARDSYRAQVELLIRCCRQSPARPTSRSRAALPSTCFFGTCRDCRSTSTSPISRCPIASGADRYPRPARHDRRRLKRTVPGVNVQLSEGDAPKLLVDKSGARIKVEPSVVIRGSLVPPVSSELCSAAQEAYELFVEIQRLDLADLYAGKLCAALDRQHPRDLFDVMHLQAAAQSRIPYARRLSLTSPVTGARSQSFCSRTANQSRICSPTTSPA
jgi:hypothetical protein